MVSGAEASTETASTGSLHHNNSSMKSMKAMYLCDFIQWWSESFKHHPLPNPTVYLHKKHSSDQLCIVMQFLVLRKFDIGKLKSKGFF